MPPLPEKLAEGHLSRIMSYGVPKTKKTWWAGRAAEWNFNVTIIDGDDGSHILKMIPAEFRHRINIINAVDQSDRPVMALFMTRFLKGAPFLWDETNKLYVPIVGNRNKSHSHYLIIPSRLNAYDLIIPDSWTALVWSLMWRFFKENNIDITAGEQAIATNWDVYRWSGAIANWMLAQLHALPCHVNIICHETVYEKSHSEKHDGKWVRVVDLTRTQVKSVSGPHGMELGKHFSDILHFVFYKEAVKIDTKAEEEKDGGSRLIPPAVYNWDALNWGKLCEYGNFKMPGKDNPPSQGILYFPPGADIDEGLMNTPTIPQNTAASILNTSNVDLLGNGSGEKQIPPRPVAPIIKVGGEIQTPKKPTSLSTLFKK